MKIKEEGRNPRLQWSHIFCYPKAITYMDKPWLVVCDPSGWSSIQPQTIQVLLPGHSIEVPNWGQRAARVESESPKKGLQTPSQVVFLCPLQ